MWQWVDNMNWVSAEGVPLPWPNEGTQKTLHSFKSYFFTVLTGDLEPLFPYLAVSFAGSLIGLVLAKPKTLKRFPLWGGLTSIVFLTIAGILIAVGELPDFDFTRPDMTYFCLLFGTQLGIVFLLLWLVEYRSNAEKFANRKVVRTFRLWGMVALSIYSLQVIVLIPLWLISLLIPTNLVTRMLPYEEAGYVLLITFMVIVFFHYAIKLWSKVDFKLSFEWLIIRLSALGQKRISQRLDVDYIMNKVKWMNYQNIEK